MTNSNQKVLAKLRRLRLLAEGAGTEGERSAAEAAQRRLVERLEKEGVHVAPELVQAVGASTPDPVDTSELGVESEDIELEDFDIDDEEIMTVIAPAVVDGRGQPVISGENKPSVVPTIPPGGSHRPATASANRGTSPSQVGRDTSTRKNTIPGGLSTHPGEPTGSVRSEGAIKTKENPTPAVGVSPPVDEFSFRGASQVRRPPSRGGAASLSTAHGPPSRGIPTPPLAESVRSSLSKGIPTPPFASDPQSVAEGEDPWGAKTRVKASFGGAAAQREGTRGSAEDALNDAFSSFEGPQKTTAMYVGTIPDELVSEWTQEPPERTHSRFRSSVHGKPKAKPWHRNWFLTRFGGIVVAGVLTWIYFAPVDVETQRAYVTKSQVPTDMPSVDINESVKQCVIGVNRACVVVGAAIAVETRGAKWGGLGRAYRVWKG